MIPAGTMHPFNRHTAPGLHTPETPMPYGLEGATFRVSEENFNRAHLSDGLLTGSLFPTLRPGPPSTCFRRYLLAQLTPHQSLSPSHRLPSHALKVFCLSILDVCSTPITLVDDISIRLFDPCPVPLPLEQDLNHRGRIKSHRPLRSETHCLDFCSCC